MAWQAVTDPSWWVYQAGEGVLPGRNLGPIVDHNPGACDRRIQGLPDPAAVRGWGWPPRLELRSRRAPHSPPARRRAR